MKQSLTILLIFTLLGPSLSRTWILLDFKIHRDFIAEVFCINKDVPEVMCNGSCYLTNQLEQNEQKEKTPFAAAKTWEIVYYFHKEKVLPSIINPSIITHHFRCGRVFFSSNYLGEVFHPPKGYPV